MSEFLPTDKDDDLIAHISGDLLNRMNKSILENRWTTGWGLLSTKGVNGGVITLDESVLSESYIWRPAQYRVTAIESDYLKCVTYQPEFGGAGTAEILIAKPIQLRSDIEKWTTEPSYVVDVSTIWAARFNDNGAVDSDGFPVPLMDMNLDARRSDRFWAKITGASGGTNNQWVYAWTEMERIVGGWQTLTDGRSGTVSTLDADNSIEYNNTDSGVEGNSVDVGGSIFTANSGLALKEVKGNPIVRMQRIQTADSAYEYSFAYVNAIDGSCA